MMILEMKARKDITPRCTTTRGDRARRGSKAEFSFFTKTRAIGFLEPASFRASRAPPLLLAHHSTSFWEGLCYTPWNILLGGMLHGARLLEVVVHEAQVLSEAQMLSTLFLRNGGEQ